MSLRENLPFMAKFFNRHQKLCQGTNDYKLIHIHNLYFPRLQGKPKDCFRGVSLDTYTFFFIRIKDSILIASFLDNFVKEIYIFYFSLDEFCNFYDGAGSVLDSQHYIHP